MKTILGVIITYIDDARCHDYGSDEYYDKSFQLFFDRAGWLHFLRVHTP